MRICGHHTSGFHLGDSEDLVFDLHVSRRLRTIDFTHFALLCAIICSHGVMMKCTTIAVPLLEHKAPRTEQKKFSEL